MILLFLIVFSIQQPVYPLQCHSCLTYCKTINGKVDPINCDCQSDNNQKCEANACFVKVELFPDETTAIVQKGCISDIPAGQKGCQYASNTDSIHCFCEKDNCNTRHMLNNFQPTRLPTIECCMCTSKNGGEEECDNHKHNCRQKCRGNYCVIDFDGNEQGCGLGYPRLPSFLRVDNYLSYRNDYICTRYESSTTHVMNGCVCTHPSGLCNDLKKVGSFQQKNVLERRIDGLQYCYAMMHKAYKPFGEEVFKKSSTCEGHFCFISLTTSEIVLESADFKHNYEDHDEFIGVSRPRYELQAGCIKVDSDDKIQLGCTEETQGNSSEILAKHCICEGHLCNFHHLVKGLDDPRPKVKSVSAEKAISNVNNKINPPVRLYTAEVEEAGNLFKVSGATSMSTFIFIFNFLIFLYISF